MEFNHSYNLLKCFFEYGAFINMVNEEYNPSENISDDNKERLVALSKSMELYRVNLTYVDYKQAEKYCEVLAAQMLKIYTPDEIQSFYFKAIPRGGFIVMGMLSYALNLKPEQFKKDLKPVIIVDDCVISGARIAKTLEETDSDHVIIATLYSHPELRKSVLESEKKVKHFFSVNDLFDRARENFPDADDYNEWKNRMKKRMGGKRYWIGQPDIVGFAWNEPDYPFWNNVTEKLEDGWRHLPPHKCLKNKISFGIEPDDESRDEIRMSAFISFGIFNEDIWLFNSKTDEILALDGVAAQIFSALMSYGNIDSTVKHLLNLYGAPENLIRNDVQELVNDLLEKGVLEYKSNVGD